MWSRVVPWPMSSATRSWPNWIASISIRSSRSPTHDREVPGLLDKEISGSRGDVLELEGGDMQPLHRGSGVREAEQLSFRVIQKS